MYKQLSDMQNKANTMSTLPHSSIQSINLEQPKSQTKTQAFSLRMAACNSKTNAGFQFESGSLQLKDKQINQHINVSGLDQVKHHKTYDLHFFCTSTISWTRLLNWLLQILWLKKSCSWRNMTVCNAKNFSKARMFGIILHTWLKKGGDPISL